MTYDELYQILEPTGIPFEIHHWERPPAPPYGVYFDDYTDNFGADDRVYCQITHFCVELYQLHRDRALEQKIEAALDAADRFWDRVVEYIDSERLYQTRYEIEV